MKRTRAFTLIELLVVIGIIGVLSAIVLASLAGSRSQGNDTAVKADLATIQTQGVLYYGIGNTYGATNPVSTSACTTGGSGAAATVFSDTGSNGLTNTISAAVASAQKSANGGAANVYCGSDATWFLAAAKLSNGDFWCVDYTGTSTEKTTRPAANKKNCSY